jgi:uncharacterized protein
MFIFKKNQKLLERLEEYLNVSQAAINEFVTAFKYVLKKGIDEHFEVLARQTHSIESNADDIRRKIEQEMYAKSLLPESRRDLLEIIEQLDRLPNRAESILNMFLTQQTPLIDAIKPDMIELVALSSETVVFTIEATRDCFYNTGKMKELSRLIDNNESIGDRLERKMITTIFSSDIDSGDKLIQKEFVLELGAICDLCERVSDKLVITSIKRSI